MYSELQDYGTSGCCRVPGTIQKNENTTQHSCCKLDSYNWLEDIDDIVGNRRFDCVEVRFKNSRKDFFRSPDIRLKRGDIIAVESSPGHDIGIVNLTGETARLQMIKKGKNPKSPDIKKVYRLARSSDIDKWMTARSREADTMVRTRKIINRLGLDMKLNDVEYQGDNTKAIFYYTAEDRVDFRELIKILAEEFRIRIEMKQIGVRQESGRLGGIGPCGRELCCSSWMSGFKSVSTASARTQNLSLNPQKLAGMCGKLKCCLNFEEEQYAESLRLFPDTRVKLETKNGKAFFQKMDILKGMMWYSYEDKPEVFIPITREDVAEIQQMNKNNQLPDSLDDYTETIENDLLVDNLLDNEDLNRFDKPARKAKNKRRKKSGNKNRNGQSRNASRRNGPQDGRKGDSGQNRRKNEGGGGQRQNKRQGNHQGGNRNQRPQNNRNKGNQNRNKKNNNRPNERTK